MSRKSPVEQAEAAIAKVLKQREVAVDHLKQLDETIARLTTGLTGAVPAVRTTFVPMPPPIDEEPLVIPDNISPADTMGEGRIL